tara:strand:- start:270 stop:455 length:186 start_codon:yes stop_codon:yes gene_type:complete
MIVQPGGVTVMWDLVTVLRILQGVIFMVLILFHAKRDTFVLEVLNLMKNVYLGHRQRIEVQ